MTTIATDGKSMAGDGRECCGDTISGNDFVKVHLLPDGRIVGISGNSYDGDALLQWMKEGGTKPKMKHLRALVLNPDGKVLWHDEHLMPSEAEPPCAIGSGSDFALAAMDMGASPEEAVAAAAKRNIHTGGKITVIHLAKDGA
jgi:ATP-dependent protease HslVU (ClpYQ) peptidase subunit